MRPTQPQTPPRRRPTTRRVVVALAGVALLGLVASVLPVGAQELRLVGLRGEQLREADLAQGSTIVVVWASWSPRGRDVVERVNAIDDRWGRQARVITVNFQEDRGAVESFLAGKSLRVPVFLDVDGDFARKNSVTNLPGLLIVKDGAVAFRGKLPDDADTTIGNALR